MSLKSQDTPLQSGVDFMIESKAGACDRNRASSIRTWEFGTSMSTGDSIAYGGGCIVDTDYGIKPPESGDAVAGFKGFAIYENTGVIDDGGYVKGGLFFNVAVCELGYVVVPVVAGITMAIGDTVYLYYGSGSTDADYNKITNVSTTAIDISTKVSVVKMITTGLALVSVVKYAD